MTEHEDFYTFGRVMPALNVWSRWASEGPYECDCRKRQHGQPRADSGMCNGGARTRIYRWRQEAQEFNRLLVQGHEDPDSDAMATFFSNTDGH